MSLTSSLLCIYVDVDAIVERQMRPCQSRWWHRGKKHTLSPSEAAKQMHRHLTPVAPSSVTTDIEKGQSHYSDCGICRLAIACIVFVLLMPTDCLME
ncbi:hypothetical protein BHE74_00009917 [Ensete ventricosum]|nr:hypothetical protein GW17_00006654 [Ensete ventricosum]RWW81665.1 hypothetical protein BHE74_00009917 [Ensete ventricosum]